MRAMRQLIAVVTGGTKSSMLKLPMAQERNI